MNHLAQVSTPLLFLSLTSFMIFFFSSYTWTRTGDEQVHNDDGASPAVSLVRYSCRGWRCIQNQASHPSPGGYLLL